MQIVAAATPVQHADQGPDYGAAGIVGTDRLCKRERRLLSDVRTLKLTAIGRASLGLAMGGRGRQIPIDRGGAGGRHHATLVVERENRGEI